MADTKPVTRPSRKRTETTPTEKPKAEKPKAAKPAEPVVEAAEESIQRLRFNMEHVGDTKTYSKFQPPEGMGVGTYYAPLGTQAVKVLLEGPTS